MGIFEDLFPAELTGDINAEVLDPNGISPPATVIRDTDDWSVRVNWHITGAAAPLLGGMWKVAVYAESIGPGDEKELGSESVALGTVHGDPRPYERTINVPAGSLVPAVYRLVTVLTYTNGGNPYEIAGFAEGPFVQIYDAS